MTGSPPVRVLFLCTHNSARSQMAEGFLRAWGGRRYQVASAGTEATRVRPEAIAAMAELGIDIAVQTSKTLERYRDEDWDLVVTVCDRAREACPVFPGALRTDHWAFDDPSEVVGSEAERMAGFRRVRDEIGARIRAFLESEPPARA
jgi:arsenate reductase